MWINPKSLLGLLMALVTAPALAQAPAPVTGPVYAVIYFEAGPAAANAVAASLKQFVAATRKEDGNTGFVALREAGRAGRPRAAP